MLHNFTHCSYNFNHSPSSLIIDFSICLIEIIMNYVIPKTHSMQFFLGENLPKNDPKNGKNFPKGYIYIYNIFTIMRFLKNDILAWSLKHRHMVLKKSNSKCNITKWWWVWWLCCWMHNVVGHYVIPFWNNNNHLIC